MTVTILVKAQVSRDLHIGATEAEVVIISGEKN